MRQLCGVVHQFSLVGGPDYDRKGVRLEQLLERLPVPGAAPAPAALVLVDPSSAAEVTAIVDRHRRRALAAGAGDAAAAAASRRDSVGREATEHGARKVATPCWNARRILQKTDAGPAGAAAEPRKAAGGRPLPVHVEVVSGAAPSLPKGPAQCSCIINYDLPPGAQEYLRRAVAVAGDGAGFPPSSATAASSAAPAPAPRVVYTLVREEQLRSRACLSILGLLRRARSAAAKSRALGGRAKAVELDSALQQIEEGEEDEASTHGGGQGGNEDDPEACDCVHCRGLSVGCASYHASAPGAPLGALPRVEAVRLPLRALEDLDRIAPLVAPRLRDHTATVICLHNMYCHTPWDSFEHLFSLPEGFGSVRVVMVLATGGSWHDYPDVGTFAGGVAWADIMDMDSMDRTDRLVERLVEHEISLLDGCSERVVLMGASQGGGQSMLRFLRSRRRLGGWIGAVCHAPTVPHVPRHRDPLLAACGGQHPPANRDRPMRLLAGEADCTFPTGLVLRDAERLRAVGGFTDVKVDVQKALTHEGPPRDEAPPQELLFLQRHLPSMVCPLPAVPGIRSEGSGVITDPESPASPSVQ